MRHVSFFVSIFASLTIVACTATAQATVLKADNTTNLDLSGSWVGGTVPSSTDVVEWDSTVTGPNSTLKGSTPTEVGVATWGGIKISNPGGAVTISSSGAYPAGDINPGASGIDMSTATQNLTINLSGGANLRPNADQTWTVASGRTLTINNAASVKTVTIEGAGDVSLGQMLGWGDVIKNSTGTLSSGLFGSGSDVFLNAGLTQLTATDAVRHPYSVTVNSGAVLDGGTYFQRIQYGPLNLDGGTLSGAGMEWGSFCLYTDVNTLGGANTSIMSADRMLLWGDGYGNDMHFNVASGATSGIDLDVTGTFGHNDGVYTTNSLIKNGAGVMRLTGENTYRGDTTVNEGTLIIGDGTSGSIVMGVADSGDYTQILGTGTVVLNGTIKLEISDVSGAGTWTLVDVSNLDESFGDNFAIEHADETTFTDIGGLWTYDDGTLEWLFNETSGILRAGSDLLMPGDANTDGFVNEADAAILSANWLKSSGAVWVEGDFDHDGDVDDVDATIMAANWTGGGGVAVPEPGTLVLFAGCALFGIAGLRRRFF